MGRKILDSSAKRLNIENVAKAHALYNAWFLVSLTGRAGHRISEGTMRNDIAVNAERQEAISIVGRNECGGGGGHRTRIGRMLLASAGTSYLLLLSARPATAKEPTGSW